jgi:hypothetical protein
MIGRTDGGRVLTLVIERTSQPTTWMIVTDWSAPDGERKSAEFDPSLRFHGIDAAPGVFAPSWGTGNDGR